jgi:hypothetical protein
MNKYTKEEYDSLSIQDQEEYDSYYWDLAYDTYAESEEI